MPAPVLGLANVLAIGDGDRRHLVHHQTAAPAKRQSNDELRDRRNDSGIGRPERVPLQGLKELSCDWVLSGPLVFIRQSEV
jgi:hypothetical protein